MKKILLATSILAATTGFAAAEVALTGDARMGVVYDGEDVQFSQRARVQFNLSGQTDTGLEFGASFRAHEAGDAQSGGYSSNFGEREGIVWISGAFGKLAMGDVNSAAEEAFGDLSGVGFSGLNDYADIPYISGDGAGPIGQGPGALYTYATGAFEFHLGMTDGTLSAYNQTDLGSDVALDGFEDNVDTAYSVAAAYSADTFKVGLGYLDNGDSNINGGTGASYGGSQWIVYGSTEVSGFGLKAYYSSFDDFAAGYLDSVGTFELDKSYGLSVDYTFGATTVTGFFRRDEIAIPANTDGVDGDVDPIGVGAAYDLGGGASLHAGVVDTDFLGSFNEGNGSFDQGQTIADFGIKLKF